jgi:hypothetical protein
MINPERLFWQGVKMLHHQFSRRSQSVSQSAADDVISLFLSFFVRATLDQQALNFHSKSLAIRSFLAHSPRGGREGYRSKVGWLQDGGMHNF